MSEIADAVQIIRVSMDGLELAIKLGSGTVENIQKLLKFLHGMLAYEKHMGKTSMKKLLMRGGDLQVLQFKESDMKKVKRYAKKYGVLYTVLPNMGKDKDKVEILFHSEAVPRINLLMQKMKSDEMQLKSMDTYLKEAGDEELSKFDQYLHEQKQGNLDVHADENLDNLLAKVGRYAVERKSVSVDEVRQELAVESEKAEKALDKLKRIGVVGEPDQLGNYKVMMDKQSFEESIKRYQKLAERMRMIAASKNTNLVDIAISTKMIEQENVHAIKTRIPYTWGNRARYIWINKHDIVEINDGKTLLTYLDKEKDYKIYSKDNDVLTTLKGEELYKRSYSPVDKAVREKQEEINKQKEKLSEGLSNLFTEDVKTRER